VWGGGGFPVGANCRYCAVFVEEILPVKAKGAARALGPLLLQDLRRGRPAQSKLLGDIQQATGARHSEKRPAGKLGALGVVPSCGGVPEHCRQLLSSREWVQGYNTDLRHRNAWRLGSDMRLTKTRAGNGRRGLAQARGRRFSAGGFPAAELRSIRQRAAGWRMAGKGPRRTENAGKAPNWLEMETGKDISKPYPRGFRGGFLPRRACAFPERVERSACRDPPGS